MIFFFNLVQPTKKTKTKQTNKQKKKNMAIKYITDETVIFATNYKAYHTSLGQLALFLMVIGFGLSIYGQIQEKRAMKKISDGYLHV